jgi:hypothetical protein
MINALISSISEKSLSNFIRIRNSKFIEYKEDLSYLVDDFDQFDNLSKLGEIEYDNTDVLLVFSCVYNGILSTRSARKMQFEIAKKALKEDFKDGAVFVFYDGVGNFRFSFIRKNYGDKEQKYSNWKRFTYFVDPVSQTNRTFKDRIGECNFDSLENIQNAFIVEPISKEFFDGYKAQYEKFCSFMQTDKKMQYNFREFLTDGTNKAIRDYVKKMLGRIVFLHFLQKKGWMGVSKDSKSWTGGDQNFIENLFMSSSKEQKANFLDDVLEPMFFDSLNKRRHNDWYDTKTPIGIVKIPYLNGGLFEPDSLDEPVSIFPARYFEELFLFFNQFNFTIDENDPNDAEVGVDPEMLGHIFENLLEDNKDKKDKGAFYTPKEIVHYMCQTSLIEYLCTALSIENTEEKNLIDVLVKYHIIDEKLHPIINKINIALDNVKICDPAIGSGAFPMGLLHEIFAIKQVLWFYEHNNLDSFPASEVKLNIIQNSIYGVDIEKGAVDIARLRFWLSLVVDEEIPQPLPNLDYKIVCGNSLISRYPMDIPITEVFAEYNKGRSQKFTLEDYKFMVSDYLNVHEGKDIFKNKIEEIKNAFKSVLSHGDILERKKVEKKVLEYEAIDFFGNRKADLNKKDYKEAKNKLELYLISEKEILENKKYSNSFEWRFEFPSLLDEDGSFTGFDIVIGNPPYVFSRGNLSKSDKDIYNRLYNLTQFKINLYILFIERGYSLLGNKGVFYYITPNNWLTLDTNSDLREFILTNTFEIKVLQNYASVFENADVDTVIIGFNKEGKDSVGYFEWVDKVPTLITNKPRQEYLKKNKFIISNASNLEDLSFVEEIKGIELQEICDVKNGVQAYTVGEGTPICTEETRKNRAYHSDIKHDKSWIKYLDGEDVCRYSIGWSGQYLKYGRNLSRPRKYDLFIGERILVRQIPNQLPYCINACYTNVETINDNNSMIVKIIDSNYKIKYILGVLNSKLISKWFALHFGKLSRKIFPQFKINELRIFPIAPANQAIQKHIEDLVTEIINMKLTGKDTIEIEQEIEGYIYRLYDLTFSQVKLIDIDFNLTQSEYESIKLNK